MNATDYLKRSALIPEAGLRSVSGVCGRLRRQNVERRFGSAMHVALAEPVSGSDGLACWEWTCSAGFERGSRRPLS